jgi:hypothetical protein
MNWVKNGFYINELGNPSFLNNEKLYTFKKTASFASMNWLSLLNKSWFLTDWEQSLALSNFSPCT